MKLGKYALYGKDEESSSLTMRSNNEMICCLDLPNLTSINSEGSNFVWPHSVILESNPCL